MQRNLLGVAGGLVLAAVGACATSPAAPSSLPSSTRVSPFANVVGDYRLTIEIDDKCTGIPKELKVRTYDVAIEDKGWHFIPVRIIGKGFGYLGGELWPPAPDARYRFEWNNIDVGGCDYPEPTGSIPLYVCGDGAATLNESTISGVMSGSAFLEGGVANCGNALHRFALVRQTGR